MSEQTLTGGCYCGALRYELTAKALFKAQCHCRPCQYFSGGGPNYFMILPAAGFAWTKGAPRTFAHPALENPRTRGFCETCGTHLVTIRPNGDVVVKVGTLDDPAAYRGPVAAIHCAEMQPFHVIAEGVQRFDRLPG